MRKILITSGLIISGFAIAAGQQVAANKAAVTAPVQAAQPKQSPAQPLAPVITLYTTPDKKAAVLETLSPKNRLIPIFKENQWIKVGDPRNGKVGWINQPDYKQAMQEWLKPNVQSIYIESVNHDGKPEVKVVAYNNGQRLSDKEAQALYQQMQTQATQQWQAMNRYHREMERFIDHQTRWMDDSFGSMMMPSIVVINPPASQKATVTAEKQDKKTSQQK